MLMTSVETSDLLRAGGGGFYIQLLNQLLEGHPLDSNALEEGEEGEEGDDEVLGPDAASKSV